MLRAIGWIVLGIIALPVAWLGSAFIYETWHTYTYRYRLTIEVEADGKLHVGTGVIRGASVRHARWVPQSPSSSSARGEAIVVDLGARGSLVALMKGVRPRADPATLVYDVFPPAAETFTLSAENMRRYSQTGLKAELHYTQFPILVRFADLRDPANVEVADPVNLSRAFGPDVALRRIILETTRDSVTTGLKSKMPWMDDKQYLQIFWRSLNMSGFPKGVSVEVGRLLKQGW